MATTNGDWAQVQQEKVNTDIVTLTRFLTEEQSKHKEATGDFTYVTSSYIPTSPSTAPSPNTSFTVTASATAIATATACLTHTLPRLIVHPSIHLIARLFFCPSPACIRCNIAKTCRHSLLCHALQFSFKSIAYYIRRATLINLTGLAGSSNTTGDDQKKLDVIGNDLFVAAMRTSGKCRLLVSEEEENCIVFDSPRARYAVVCDPIDGSSNLDAGVSVGTIFGIFKLREGSAGETSEILLPGTELVAAGFTMYGASAQLVITMKGGSVNGFTMDNALGEFILTHPNMRMPRSRAIYSVNEGNSLYWDEPVKEYFNSLKYPADKAGKPYSARYIGSMVADAYRTLLYGGIFAYPADKKSPKGKLRILYECAPMAMVFENGKYYLGG